MYPLQGIKVIELARVLAGPWIGQTLADLGAEVTKVESPQGDETRTWGPPFVKKGQETTSAYFHSANRGKKGITVDFNDPQALSNLKEKICQADVLIENFKVGGLQKYGLDYANIAALCPSLIYCSVTGFGQNGPLAHQAGYDFMIQGLSGIMDITGDPTGMPQKMGVAFADIFTGLYGVIGIQAALLTRAQTGRGQHVDMALFDCMVAAQANQNANYFASSESPKRMGNAHPNIVPYQVFAVQDGHIIIACGNDAQFVRLCTVLGHSEWGTDPRFATNAQRLAHRAELVEHITKALTQWQKADILQALEQATVPAGPINTIGQALEHPQLAHREMIIEPEGIKGLRTPIRFSESELNTQAAAPTLGQHNKSE